MEWHGGIHNIGTLVGQVIKRGEITQFLRGIYSIQRAELEDAVRGKMLSFLWIARNVMYRGRDRDNALTVALVGFQIVISCLGHVTL